jgi:hypothetical protein
VTDDLHSLAYVSRSELSGSPEELDAAVRSILESARRNNRVSGVTGALLFSEGWFAQILEGPLEAIELVFETIQCDPRHSQITVLHFHPVPYRSFPAWSMAYVGADSEMQARSEALGMPSSSCEIPVLEMGKSFVGVLQDYITRQQATQPA